MFSLPSRPFIPALVFPARPVREIDVEVMPEVVKEAPGFTKDRSVSLPARPLWDRLVILAQDGEYDKDVEFVRSLGKRMAELDSDQEDGRQPDRLEWLA